MNDLHREISNSQPNLPSVASASLGFWARLTQYAVLRCSGPDARKFLQGQLTCDVNALTPEQTSLGACCTPKGRMLALFRVAQVGDELWLRLPREVAQSLMDHLKKYMVFFKASLELDESIQVFGWVPQGQPNGVELPEDVDRAIATSESLRVRVPGEMPRYEIWATGAELDELQTQLPAEQQQPESLWLLSDILAGLGEVYTSTREEFIPQMLNLQSLGGIAFKKGCYTGQEIVARMQYLGTLKRRMYLAQWSGQTPPAPGTVIIDEKGANLGTLVRAQATQDQGIQLLAVLNQESLEAGATPAIEENGHSLPLHWREVPYPVEQISNPRKKL